MPGQPTNPADRDPRNLTPSPFGSHIGAGGPPASHPGVPPSGASRAPTVGPASSALGRPPPPPEVAAALARGARRIGRHVVLGQLGRGAMGVVHRAWDPDLRREVAIKILLDQRGSDTTARERFVREAQAVARLEHRAIVALHEVGVDDGKPYLVLELVRGETLERKLATRALSARQVVEVTAEVARALQHAHDLGIVHRDVKPSNVMLRADGQPLVMDFGVASDEGAQQQLTMTGQILGTPAFMAPEQAGEERVRPGPATDVYALGALLYLGLTGEPPFAASDPFGMLKHVLFDRPIPPRRIDRTIPKELERTILTCLEKDPADRIESAEELAEILDDLIASGRLATGRPAKKAPPARRSPLLAIAGIAALAIAAGVTAFAIVSRREAPSTPTSNVASNSVPVPVPVPVPEAEAESESETPETPETAETPETPETPEAPPAPATGTAAEIRRLMKEAHQARRARQNARAIELFDRILELDPESSSGWERRGLAKIAADDFAGAVLDLEISTRLAPDRGSTWGGLGYARYLTGDLEQSLVDLGRATELAPDEPRWWVWLGDVRRKREDYVEGIACYTHAVELDPENAGAFRRRGVCRQRSGDLDGAFDDFSRGIELAPKVSTGWGDRGLVRHARGDRDGALADFREYFARRPRPTNAVMSEVRAAMAELGVSPDGS